MRVLRFLVLRTYQLTGPPLAFKACLQLSVQEFMAKCGDASASTYLSLPTALPELKAREGGDFREGPLPETRGGFGNRGGSSGGCACCRHPCLNIKECLLLLGVLEAWTCHSQHHQYYLCAGC